MKNKKTTELIVLLTEAMKTGNQTLINTYAYELTCRLCVPNDNYTFEQTLEGLGYRRIEKTNPNQITIEEYMRGCSKNDDEWLLL